MSGKDEQDVHTNEFSEEELSALSDEEREALEADDNDSSEDSNSNSENQDSENENQADDQNEGGENDEASEEAGSEKAASEAGDQGSEGEQEDPAKEADSQGKEGSEGKGKENPDEQEYQLPPDQLKAVEPKREVSDISKIENREKEITDEFTALDEQLQEGEIEIAEYTQKTRALQNEQINLALEKNNSVRNAQENELEIGRQWDSAIDQFYANPANKGFDAPDNGGNAVLYNALNGTLQDLQKSNPGNSPAWYIAEAHKQVQEAMGLKSAEPEKTGSDKKADNKGKEKHERRKSALEDADIPATLNNLPSAKPTDQNDEFAHLDSLDGEDLELAVSQMNKSQMDRWAAR